MGRLEGFKQRGRNRQSRKRNPIIVIGCEGANKTEEIYFKNFNTRRCIIKFSTGNSTDPVGIVKDLIKFIDENTRKSIPYEYLKEKGFVIKESYNPALDYLKIVDEVYLERM